VPARPSGDDCCIDYQQNRHEGDDDFQEFRQDGRPLPQRQGSVRQVRHAWNPPSVSDSNDPRPRHSGGAGLGAMQAATRLDSRL
jgi:hypothetical protein